ncbi:Na(+) H(+) antiporter subunit C [plant metagenome]
MSLIYAASIAAIMALGLYLLLSRHILRIAYGVMLISATVNLVIFLAGRIGNNPPPVMSAGETALAAGSANPLPQALVLTAIVIGFSLVAFLVALALKTYQRTGTLDHRELGDAEALGSPYPASRSDSVTTTAKEARQ